MQGVHLTSESKTRVLTDLEIQSTVLLWSSVSHHAVLF